MNFLFASLNCEITELISLDSRLMREVKAVWDSRPYNNIYMYEAGIYPCRVV